MIVLDVSVIIAHLVPGDAHAEQALEILGSDEDLAIHPITLAESLVGSTRVGREQESLRLLDGLGIVQLDFPPDQPMALARLRAATGLRLPDCCALASADHEGAVLATFDRRLAEAAQRIGVSVRGAQ